MLNIIDSKTENALLIKLEGRLDTTSSPQLETFINANIDNIKQLNFDLEHLTYISSAGLRVLLSAQKVMNKQGSMLIKNADSAVKEIFEVTGFSEIFTIE